MQDLLILLSDQSKVIGNLQKTIEGLNITIKSLNDKIERMEFSNGHLNSVHENDESPKGLENNSLISDGNEKAVGFSVHENVKQSEKVQIKAQIQDSNKHKITVHEKVKIPKCK